MLKDEDIIEIFQLLGLLNEADRQKIMSKSNIHKTIYSESLSDVKYQIVADNVTIHDDERNANYARLE